MYLGQRADIRLLEHLGCAGAPADIPLQKDVCCDEISHFLGSAETKPPDALAVSRWVAGWNPARGATANLAKTLSDSVRTPQGAPSSLGQRRLPSAVIVGHGGVLGTRPLSGYVPVLAQRAVGQARNVDG